MVSRTLFLHVGTSKSGTSSLQGALWASPDELAAQGVGLPFEGRTPAVRRLLTPLGWRVAEGFTQPVDAERLALFARRLRQTPGDRLLISNEDLAEASRESVDALFDVLASVDIEPVVVITARDWSKQLPSEYQQLLKHNITLTFDSFLQEVRERVGIGEQFWQRQDLPDICERWGRHLDPARVHVISVPAFKVDPEAVYRLFGEVVGFDFKALDAPKRDTNASFGVVEAEVLRRFNVALDGRLANYSEEYMPAVRNDLIRHCIARGASARLAVPPEHHEWVRELSQQRLDVLLGRGYTLHGDPKTLLSPVDVGQSVHEATDAEIAEAAISTLATFAVRTYERQRRARRAT